LDSGGATIADEIGGADGADSSACQSNGMAAAVRRNRRSEQTQAIPQTVGGRKQFQRGSNLKEEWDIELQRYRKVPMLRFRVYWKSATKAYLSWNKKLFWTMLKG